jgi:hypothetical protein
MRKTVTLAAAVAMGAAALIPIGVANGATLPAPVVLSAKVDPTVGGKGGTATVSAIIRHATECRLKLLSKPLFHVSYSTTEQPCSTSYLAYVKLGANPTSVIHAAAFDLIVSNGHQATARLFYVELAPKVAAPTRIAAVEAPTTLRVTTTTVAPSTTTTAGSAPSWWLPGTGQIEWQWELDHPLNLSSATDMGTGDNTYNNQPAINPTVYDIDGIENPASTVSALHAMGDHVICYIEVGSVGNYYTAAQEGIATSYYQQYVNAGVVGSEVPGWDENYLNTTSPATLAITEAMVQQQCAAKGFDAVETDEDETWQYATGFNVTEASTEAYDTAIGQYIHNLGMAWFIKNPDDVGNTSFSDAEFPYADAVITEQCNLYDTCADLGDFIGHKAIFNAEYTDGGNAQSTAVTPTDTAFCPSDNAQGFNGELFDLDLDGQVRVPCR